MVSGEIIGELRGKALAVSGVLTDEESAIKQLVQELGLEPHVSFLPFRPDLQQVYDALDILAFPNPGVGRTSGGSP